MIEGFEDYTATLTEDEKLKLVPALVKILQSHVGPANAIRSKEICRRLTLPEFPNLTDSRIRKCINFIRTNGLVQYLIAGANGYYCATSIDQMQRYIISLDQRATAIWAVRSALARQLSGTLLLFPERSTEGRGV